jgi:DMSO/TMAO reductase YedYZ molybdopterin-dependent catalytic subunit
MTASRHHLVCASVVGLLATAVILSGCAGVVSSGGGPSGTGGALPSQLATAEVKAYQGKNLSSVNDFRENSINGPQYVDVNTYRLKVDGLVDVPSLYTYGEVIRRFEPVKKVVTLNCVEGWDVTILWQGVLLTDLVDTARAKPTANTIVFHAVDGYTTSMPLQYARDKKIVFAYMMNGIPIPPERGFPFMVVAEDKWGYKWCKWVERIELGSDPSYRGFWESRGYSNTGNLSAPFFAQ